MCFKRLILLVAGVFYVYCSTAQIQGEYVQSRILILLDESSSMIQPWASGKQKYKAAHEIILKLMDSVYAVNNQVQFGLRVFGHQHTVPENDCYDTKNEVAFSFDNRNQMMLRLDDIHPLGVTPIAFALTEAANKDLIDETHNAYSIILITDGGESCGGDICEVMKKLVKNKVFFKPYIVSLENDPTLKTTYSCMGDFLQVTTEGEIPKAVKTIVDAFKPVLKMTRKDYTEITSSSIPSVMKVSTPPKTWKVPVADIIPELIIVQPKGTTKTAEPQRVRPVAIDLRLPPVVKEAMPKVESVPVLPAASLRTSVQPEFKKVKPVKFVAKLPPVAPEAPLNTKEETIARLKPAAVRKLNVIYVIDEHTYSPRPVPPLPPVRPEKGPEPKVADKKPAEEKKPEYKVEREDAAETTLEVYITNGAGKYYTTTPQVLLLDPKTNSTVKSFYRYVGPDGTPDPQTGITPGVYHLTFAANRSYDQPVTILPNKKNKVIVTVKNTTLSFAYKEPPFTPIKEGWVATVTERNKTNGRVQDQQMNERLKYEPGNYHIEINTFPRMYRNEDLDFDFESVITIDHPGFAKFVATDPKTTSVNLYQRMGDKFLMFHTLDLNDARSQHLPIQPGDYQAHFRSGAAAAYSSSEKVVVFRIKPNEETVVELK